MGNSKKITSAVALSAIAALLALSGCAAGSPTPSQSTPAAASNDAAAARMVACLTDEGQTAKIIGGGQVAVLQPTDPAASGDAQGFEMGQGSGTVGMVVDDEGTWIAAADAADYTEDGGQRAAWETCATKVPEFAQPAPDMSAKGEGEQIEMSSSTEAIAAALAFAACARANGYSGFADPDAQGRLTLPADITEQQTRGLLDACADEMGDIPPALTQDSAEALGFDWSAVVADYFDGAFTTTTITPDGSR